MTGWSQRDREIEEHTRTINVLLPRFGQRRPPGWVRQVAARFADHVETHGYTHTLDEFLRDELDREQRERFDGDGDGTLGRPDPTGNAAAKRAMRDKRRSGAA